MALIAIPEFSKWQQLLVERTNWSDAQFKGRLSRYVRLPLLTEEDLTLIARHLMPNGSAACIRLLVGYGISSKCNASAISETLKSAWYRAQKEKRSEVDLSDIKKAIQEDQLPTERALPAMVSGRSWRNGRRASADTRPHASGAMATIVFDGGCEQVSHL